MLSLCYDLGLHGTVLHVTALITHRQIVAGAPRSFNGTQLRYGTCDVHVYRKVACRGEYTLPWIRSPRTILDAGAHIGLATICFGSQFPEAQIAAVEVANENYRILVRNVGHLGSRVRTFNCALWNKEMYLPLRDRATGNWGFSVAAAEDQGHVLGSVKAVTVPWIIGEMGWENIDLFKCDIEGAEDEVFGRVGPWLERVNVLVIELHDRIRPGCARRVSKALSGFPVRFRKGENQVFAREGWLEA